MEIPTRTAVQTNHAIEGSPTLSVKDCSPFSGRFDDRTISTVKRLVCAITRAPYLQQEREDCLQEALLHFWQAMKKNPGQRLHSYLGGCRFFIKDRLKHGKSVDSLKRRWKGYSLDSFGATCPLPDTPELLSSVDPREQASAADDMSVMMSRLNRFDRIVLNLFVEGNGTREVARRLRVSPSGVGKSRERIRFIARQIGLSPVKRLRGPEK